MMRRSGLSILVACAVLAAALAVLALPGTGTSSQEPPFAVEVRKATVVAWGTGVLVAEDLAMTHAHGSVGIPNLEGSERPVSFFGLRNVLDPEAARLGKILPPEFTKRGRVLCSFRDIDIEWVRLLEPPPEGVRPVKLGGAMVPPLYVVGPYVSAMARYIGERLGVNAVTGATDKRPALELIGAVGVTRGASGLPVVNARGEVVGLISGGSEDGSIAVLTGPVRHCKP